MRNRLQQVLLSTTYASITPILSLSSSSHPNEEEAVAHTHIDQVIKIISVVVVYEQGVDLKSSITVDTSSRKDLTLQGVPTAHYKSPHTRLDLPVGPVKDTHTRVVPREPDVIIPLTNND